MSIMCYDKLSDSEFLVAVSGMINSGDSGCAGGIDLDSALGVEVYVESNHVMEVVIHDAFCNIAFQVVLTMDQVSLLWDLISGDNGTNLRDMSYFRAKYLAGGAAMIESGSYIMEGKNA